MTEEDGDGLDHEDYGSITPSPRRIAAEMLRSYLSEIPGIQPGSIDKDAENRFYSFTVCDDKGLALAVSVFSSEYIVFWFDSKPAGWPGGTKITLGSVVDASAYVSFCSAGRFADAAAIEPRRSKQA